MNLQPQNISQAVSFNDLSVPYIRALFGTALILLSLYATISFMSQGFSGLAFLSVVIFCLSIEVVKILSAGDIGFYLALKKTEKAILAAVIVGILVCLSIGAETWFLVSGSLKETTLIEQTSGQTSTLQTRIADKQAQLATCNPTSLSKCVNPRTAELEALQTELAAITAASSTDVAQTEAKANAKFWTQVSAASGTTPENLILGLNIIRAILQELFGVYFLGQYSTWKRLRNLKSAPMERDVTPQVQVAPQVQTLPQTQVAPPAVYHPPRPQAAPVSSVPSDVVIEARKASRRSPTRRADIWTPKEKEQLFVAHIETLRRKNADLRRTQAVSDVSDYDPESSIFDTPLKSAPPTGKTQSAMDISRLSPKN